MEDITARRIKELRTQLEMSQEELARKTGYKGRSAISQIERTARNVTVDNLKLFANALGTSPSYLMGWTDDPTPIKNAPIQQDERETAIDLFNSLPEDKKEEALQFLRFLVQQENQ